MKYHYLRPLLGALCISTILATQAQTVALYTYGQSVGTYTAITAGTVLGTEANAAQKFVDPAVPAGGTTSTGVGLPIGFNFSFIGISYDRFAVSTDGWISLGQSALGATAVNMPTTTVPISTTTAISPTQLRSRISAFGRDIRGKGTGSGSDLRYQTIGTAPNRVLVVQWSNYERASGTVGANGDILNFQIRLNEADNTVDVAWGSCAFGSGVVSTVYAQVGLGGQAATDFNNRTTTTDWNTTTAGATNTATCAIANSVLPGVIVPANGLVMKWTGANCTPPAATGSTTLNCALNQFSINVNLTSIGTGGSTVDITEIVNGGGQTVVHNDVSVLQSYAMGPYTLGSSVQVFVRHASNSVCDLTVGTFSRGIADCPVTSFPYCEDFNNFNECGTTASPCNNLCTLLDGWSNETADGLDWRSHAGTTPSSPTGPNDDITGGGKYMYIEESSPCSNLTAHMYSNEYNIGGLTNDLEVSMYYHMQGDAEMGTLTLAVEDPAGSGNFTTLFTRTGNQGVGDLWLFSNWLTVNATGPMIRFRVTGTTGAASTGLGDMAIDQFCTREQLCLAPAATASVVNINCAANTYNVRVNLTSLGSAASVNLVPSTGTPINGVTAPGTYLLGPFTLNSPVTVTVQHPIAQCDLPLGSFNTNVTCVTNGACALNLAIPDNGCATNNRLTLGIPVSTVGTQLGLDISFQSVEMIVAHLANNHVEAFLTSPNGVTVNLLGTGFFGAGDNLGDPLNCPTATLELRDGGAALSATATNNVTGIFAPNSPLAPLNDGSNPNGTWLLAFCDDLSGTVGSVVHAQLNLISCSQPAATATVVPACATSQFDIAVDLTALGNLATDVDILASVNGGVPVLYFDNVSALQVYSLTGFASGSNVVVSVLHNQDASCNLTLASLTYTCPINTFPACEDFDTWTNCSSASTCTTVCPLEEGWTNVNTSTWRTWSGSVPSADTGPDFDHTTGSGKYLYIETSTACPDRVARSPLYDIGALNGGFGAEVSAWYHMWDNGTGDMGTFSIAVEDVTNAPGVYNTIFTRSGDQGNLWNFTGWLDLSAVVGPIVRFRITGTNTLVFQGDMAFDDFCVREKLPCDLPVATATATSSCNGNSFSIAIDLTDLGTATTVDILASVNGGAPTLVHDNVSALQVYNAGPYASGQSVLISIVPDVLPGSCTIALGPYAFNADLTCVQCSPVVPVNETYCYVANDNQSWTYGTQGVGILRLKFDRGTLESSAFDDLIIYDGPDNTYPVLFANPANTGNLGPAGSGVLTNDPDFFDVEVFSSGSYLHMTFTSDGSVQCATATNYDAWQWTVTCIDCLSPAATATQNVNCATSNFTVDVALTDLGSSPTVDILAVVNGGAPVVVHNDVSALQTYVLGPYAVTDQVTVSVVHATNNDCDLPLGAFAAEFTCVTCGGAPLNETYCYVANDNQSWLYYASGTGQLRLRFLRGTLESSSFDDLIIYDGPDATSPILFSNPANTGNLGPAGSGIVTTDPDFFNVDVIATGQFLYMTFTSDGSVQCATSTTYDPWQWEVFCFDCTAPTATASVAPACPNQFFVDVNVTGLGDATDLDLIGSVNGGAPVVLLDNITATGLVQAGPFSSGSSVVLTLAHNQDALCNAPLGNFSFTCPPTGACGLYNNSTVQAIPDAGTTTSTIVTGPLNGERITDLDVVIQINHTDLADLDIRLTSPSGTIIDLLNDICASKDNMNVRFDDEAATAVVCGAVLTDPLIGTYRTSGTLADLLGSFDTQLFEGTWTLTVTDDLSSDVGSLIQWCLIPTLVIPDCPGIPTGLSVTASTFNSVTLDWTSGAGNTGYAIEYGPLGFTPGTGTVVTGTLPGPATIAGLASGATFQFYLTETCAAGDAVVVGPITGTTSLLISTYPYCQDLEGYTNSATFTCATVNTLLPSLGWVNEVEGANGTDWLTDVGGTSSTVTGPNIDKVPGTSAGKYLYVEASTCASRVARLRSPAFDVSGLANQPVVSFWYHMCGDDGAMGTLTLEMESPAGSGIWTTLFTRSGQDPDQTTENSPWKEVRVVLNNLPATTMAFRITGTTGATGFEGDMAIDYFCVTEAPCFLPQATIVHNCINLFNYQAVVNVTNIGPHASVNISDGQGNNVNNVGVGSHVLGTYPNGTNLSITVTSSSDATCISTYTYTASCVVPTDDCTDAQLLECGVTVTGNTSGFANTLPTNACPFLGAPSLGGVNWWRFSTPVAQEVVVSTCNLASFNTRLSVFEGPDCNNLTCLSLNDDVVGCSANSSELIFLAQGGVEYYIAVHGSGAASGPYTLFIGCSPPCTPATTNDYCAQAATLTPVVNDGLSTPVSGDNGCAFIDGNPSCNLVGNVQGVWYTFNSGINTEMYITLLDDQYGYTADGLSYVLYNGACNVFTATGEMACDNTGVGYDQPLPPLTPNTDYLLLVYNSGGIGVEGTFGVELSHPAQNDAGIDSVHYPNGLVCTTDIAAIVELRNYGAQTLTSVDINFQFDGAPVQTYTWTGTLVSGASELVELPNYLVTQGPHSFTVSTSDPNGVVDGIPANDANGSLFDSSGEGAVVNIIQDRFGSEITWEVYDALEIAPVASGGPYTDLPANGTLQISESICLPITFGNCFTLRVYDSFGDGMCCSFGTGRWEVRSPNSALLLRDNFHGSGTLPGSAIYDGDQSPALGANPNYSGHEFCLPQGPSNIEANECGVFTNTLSSKVYCKQSPGTGPYQFEFSNPDQAYRRRISVPVRFVKFSQLQSNPLTVGVHYFARARRDAANDGYFNDNWGSGCEMALDPSVVQGCAQLIDDTDLPTHSCGVTRRFGFGDKVWATPLLGATQYRFRFQGTIDPDGAAGPLPPVPGSRVITQTGYVRVLNWATYTLVDGETYNVQVEVQVNGVWSGYCGPVCTVTIANPAFSARGVNADAAGPAQEVLLYPNPVRDGQVTLAINGLSGEEGEVLVDVRDVFGKLVFTQRIGTEGATELITLLELGSSLASGIYTVELHMGTKHAVEYISIQ